MNKDELKTIAVIETGGTIAGTGPKGEDANYKAGELPVERILDSIPELSGKVSIKVYSVNHLDSNDISFHDYKVLKKLCSHTNSAAGLVLCEFLTYQIILKSSTVNSSY